MIKLFSFNHSIMLNSSSLVIKSCLVRFNSLRVSSIRNCSVILKNYCASFRFLHSVPLRSSQCTYLYNLNDVNQSRSCTYSTESKKEISDASTLTKDKVASEAPVVKVSQRIKLKQAVRDYGATIIVFHVAISLASLGICYVAISNGVDAIGILKYLGFSETVITSKVAVGGSTFVMAYAVHKLFAPVRIAITLSVAPFIVRYLRKINLLKPPKKRE